MNKKLSNLFWGILLVGGGLMGLAQSMGYITDLTPTFWIAVFAAVGAISLVLYFSGGIQNWGMLFPAGIFTALAFLIWRAVGGEDDPAMAAPLFIAVGLPFVAAYLLDRVKNWWALIPAGIMAFLTFIMLFVEKMSGEVIGSAMFFILAATFGSVYISRRVLWAALLAYILFVLGWMPLIESGSRPELAGSVMMFALALPFFVVYSQAPDQKYWAIIPAGFLATAGLITALVLLPGVADPEFDNRIYNAILFTGLSATFAIVWLRHNRSWGLFFTIFAALAAAGSLLPGGMEKFWPVWVVLAGFYLIYKSMRPVNA